VVAVLKACEAISGGYFRWRVGRFFGCNPEDDRRRRSGMRITVRFGLLAGCLISVMGAGALAQERAQNPPVPAQIVALDECDPSTFNAAIGPDFCKNVALGASTTFNDLFAEAQAGTPDPGWDFEPDVLHIKKGTPVVVVDQGGEPHTFTEVKEFGGGFIGDLNHGEPTVPECAGGFKNLDVAKTRILQGSQLQVTGLSKGEHRFECCIHPWMRVTVDVK
jgi:plastocyanin